jgi:crotonobetainyl-CoA:carnitine CoA-transferase CaiB-like acyl-CoA transferase
MPEALLMKQWDTRGKRMGFSGSADALPEIRQLMREAFGSKTSIELEAFFSGQPEIICERVRSHDEVLSDPQNIDNDYIVEIELPITGLTKTVGTLVAFSDTPTDIPSAPPLLGAHNAEVMMELDFSEADVESVSNRVEWVLQERSMQKNE